MVTLHFYREGRERINKRRLLDRGELSLAEFGGNRHNCSQLLRGSEETNSAVPGTGFEWYSTLVWVGFFFPTQDATCNFFKCKRGIFRGDRPVSQLKGIVSRYRLALLQQLQHTPCQLRSNGHNPKHCLEVM